MSCLTQQCYAGCRRWLPRYAAGNSRGNSHGTSRTTFANISSKFNTKLLTSRANHQSPSWSQAAVIPARTGLQGAYPKKARQRSATPSQNHTLGNNGWRQAEPSEATPRWLSTRPFAQLWLTELTACGGGVSVGPGGRPEGLLVHVPNLARTGARREISISRAA